MFIILLRFSDNKSQAPRYMEGHNQWVKKGFDDGVFLMAGSLQPNLGGGVLAHNISEIELQNRVDSDPFIKENIVSAEILEIVPAKVNEKLQFLITE